MSEEQVVAPEVVEESPVVQVAETQEELTDVVEAAIEDGATEEEVRDMIREFELKVNGKKKKVKIDLNDEKELIRRLQMAEAGQSAMQEKAEMEKMLRQEFMRWKDDPTAIFAELGLDPNEWAEQMISEKVKELQKSPEELEREKLTKELNDLRNKLKAQEEEANQVKMEQLQQQASVQLESEIVAALDEHPSLPRTRKTVSRIADAMIWAIDNGFPDVEVRDVVPAVESEIKAEFNEFISELPEEMMEAYIGKKALDKMRKKRIAAMKSAPATSNVPSVSKPKVEDKPAKDKVSAKDYFRNMR